ncbi:hypothetical protein Tco_0532570 [Tanacetum coccineum]
MMRLPLKKNKADNLHQLVGVATPIVDVNNPSVGTPKRRRKLRIKGGKEKSIEKRFEEQECMLIIWKVRISLPVFKKKEWNEVIDVDSLPDQVEPSNVPKPETVESNVLASENIPMAPFKQKKDQIKITGTTRLCRLFDEDSSDQEEDLDEELSDQEENLEEDLDEDSSYQEEDLDEDSSDQEEELNEDSGDQSEDLYKDSSDPYVFYDEDSSDLEEYLRLFDESDQEEDIGEDDSDDG